MKHKVRRIHFVGIGGSGTIFLTKCNLLCIYCQNYEISHLGYGEDISLSGAAEIMLNLQSMGCHNINLVTPTHFAPQLVKAISVAAVTPQCSFCELSVNARGKLLSFNASSLVNCHAKAADGKKKALE